MCWLVFVFGFVSAFRILKSYEEKSFLSEKVLTKIGTLYLAMSFLFLPIASSSVLLYTLVIVSLLTLIACFPLLLVVLREKRFEEQVVDVLMNLSLKMSMGESLKSAFKAQLRNQSADDFQRLLQKLYHSVTFPQQNKREFNSNRLNRLSSELCYVSTVEYGAIQALKNVIHTQKLLSDFRRKSGKAKAQVLLQAWILTGIQLALASFMISIFGFSKVLPFLAVSMLLMVLGHLCSFYLGRRIKWRI
ncbi:MAG: hypothetical protein HRT45_03100 [Bdellovibrionales bacterium]|nr:hypothetical protein [Bdellovibrionales bacterium]